MAITALLVLLQQSVAAMPIQANVIRVDGHPITVWVRKPAHPVGSILLVHGRTWSARPDFDLQVPGEQRSVMASLAALGWAAYAVDMRGYGATPRDATGWLTPNRAAADVAAVLEWVAQQDSSGHAPALVGWSLGSLVAQLVAQRHPALISRLVLYGYPKDPAESLPADPPDIHPLRQRTTRDDARADFTRWATPATVNAYVTRAVSIDSVRVDWRQLDQFNELDPRRIAVPTLLLQGELDPGVTRAQLSSFYRAIRTPQKQWITLLHGGHAALLEDTHPRFVDAVVAFLRSDSR